jgi:hypothetical protein
VLAACKWTRCEMNNDVERLAKQMTHGVTYPWRYCYAGLRPCSAPLHASGTVTASAVEWQTDAAAFGAIAGLGANVSQIMVAGAG